MNVTDNMDRLQRILNENKIYAEITNYDEEGFSILVEWGDWKHDHARLDYLMSENGYGRIGAYLMEEDGSDCYSAIHLYTW